LFQKTTLFSEIITPPIQANDHLNENQKVGMESSMQDTNHQRRIILNT
jgi:hypothetical protein